MYVSCVTLVTTPHALMLYYYLRRESRVWLSLASLQNKAEFIDRCFDTLTESALEPAADRGPYTEFTEKMMAILKSA